MASEETDTDARRTVLAKFNAEMEALKGYRDDEDSAVGNYVSAFIRQLDGEELILWNSIASLNFKFEFASSSFGPIITNKYLTYFSQYSGQYHWFFGYLEAK